MLSELYKLFKLIWQKKKMWLQITKNIFFTVYCVHLLSQQLLQNKIHTQNTHTHARTREEQEICHTVASTSITMNGASLW